MKKSDQKFVDEWGKTRQMGRLKYALTHGTFAGIFVFLFVALFQLFSQSFAEAFLSKQAGISFASLLLVSIAGYGTLMWAVNEYMYKQRVGSGQQG